MSVHVHARIRPTRSPSGIPKWDLTRSLSGIRRAPQVGSHALSSRLWRRPNLGKHHGRARILLGRLHHEAASVRCVSHYTTMRERVRTRARVRNVGTYVLPAVMATGNIHSGIIAGKLNGVMPAHTPSGSL